MEYSASIEQAGQWLTACEMVCNPLVCIGYALNICFGSINPQGVGIYPSTPSPSPSLNVSPR